MSVVKLAPFEERASKRMAEELTQAVEEGSFDAGIYMLLDEDSQITWHTFGKCSRDVLWLLEAFMSRYKKELLNEETTN